MADIYGTLASLFTTKEEIGTWGELSALYTSPDYKDRIESLCHDSLSPDVKKIALVALLKQGIVLYSPSILFYLFYSILFAFYFAFLFYIVW